MAERDEQLGSWFCLCTEDLHECFRVALDHAHIAELASRAPSTEDQNIRPPSWYKVSHLAESPMRCLDHTVMRTLNDMETLVGRQVVARSPLAWRKQPLQADWAVLPRFDARMTKVVTCFFCASWQMLSLCHEGRLSRGFAPVKSILYSFTNLQCLRQKGGVSNFRTDISR